MGGQASNAVKRSWDARSSRTIRGRRVSSLDTGVLAGAFARMPRRVSGTPPPRLTSRLTVDTAHTLRDGRETVAAVESERDLPALVDGQMAIARLSAERLCVEVSPARAMMPTIGALQPIGLAMSTATSPSPAA